MKSGTRSGILNPAALKRGLSRRGFLAASGATGAAAVGLTFSAGPGMAAEEPVLNFYNWDTYIGETTLADFKGESGIKVVMDLFADNDELFAKLRAGNPGYDVIVPSNDFVERMIAADMLMALDHTRLPALSHVEAPFLDVAFDPGRRYSIPYMWGTMGIGYRKSRVDAPPDSWSWLLESDRYQGKIAILSEAPSVLGAAFKYLGYPLNATDPAAIRAAEALLIAQKPNLKLFARDNGQDLLLSGEVDLVMEWNGDILQVMEEDPDIAYIVPREGSVLWEDALCIPVGAPHPENAHSFINYILGPEVGAGIADFIHYATPNAAAKALLPESYSSNPAIFPDAATLALCEPLTYAGPATVRLYDEAWTRIRAA